jgi:hypothetical protein
VHTSKSEAHINRFPSPRIRLVLKESISAGIVPGAWSHLGFLLKGQFILIYNRSYPAVSESHRLT